LSQSEDEITPSRRRDLMRDIDARIEFHQALHDYAGVPLPQQVEQLTNPAADHKEYMRRLRKAFTGSEEL
jgi:hypothetical protein